MIRGIIKINSFCNNSCSFCHTKTKSNFKSVSLEKIFTKINRMTLAGVTQILLSGGECTIDPDFFKILDYLHNRKISIGLVTNSRFFSNSSFLDKLDKYNLEYVHTSLHGSEKEHDMITQVSGSFLQTLQGIKYLVNKKIDLDINCVIVKSNRSNLNNLIPILESIGVSKLKYSFVEPLGFNNNIVPKISEVSSTLNKILTSPHKITLKFDNLPLCLSHSFENHRENLQIRNITHISECFEEDIFKSDTGNKIKPLICNTCSKRDTCEGLFKEYVSLFGDKELKPFT